MPRRSRAVAAAVALAPLVGACVGDNPFYVHVDSMPPCAGAYVKVGVGLHTVDDANGGRVGVSLISTRDKAGLWSR